VKNKNLRENATISDANRQQSGMATEYAPETIAVQANNINPTGGNNIVPFEIGYIKGKLEVLMDKVNALTAEAFQIRAQLEASLTNVSIQKNPSKKVGIKGMIDEMDKINKILIQTIPDHLRSIPRHLKVFGVDK
jgi:hypothetical protein